MQPILEIHLDLKTPLFAGSWEPNIVDEEFPLRPQTIKGWWRWWARAYAAGALFDSGLLRDDSKQAFNEVSELVGLKAGLGYADPLGRNSTASVYVLDVTSIGDNTPINKVRAKTTKGYDMKPPLQRITLLTRGKPPKLLQYIDTETISFKIAIFLRKQSENVGLKAGLGALLTALILSGFGKGGRRGLGCVDIREIRTKEGSLIKQFEHINASDVNSVSMLINETKNAYRTLVEKGISYPTSSSPSVPPLQLISNRIVSRSNLRVFQLYSLEGEKTLENLHNFFASTKRKSVLGEDPFRKEYIGWILGLPREQKDTGYIVKDIERRASPFILAVHKQRAYLSLFISRDWPTEIKWVGNRTKHLSINEDSLITAFSKAKSAFEKYCKRTGIRCNIVWP